MARTEREVTAEGPFKGSRIKVGTPTTIHGIIEFQSGAIVTIGASWDVASHGHHNIELYGTEGSVFVPDPNFFGGDIAVSDLAGNRTAVTPWDHPFGRANQADNNGTQRANYRTAGLSDMLAAIDEGRPARCGLDVALHAVDIMTSLLKSGEQGEVITLTTTCERPAALRPEDAQALLR
jgi:predicted dehydrogenase